MSDVVRILHVIPDMTLGGAQQVVVDLALGCDPAKFRVGVVSLFPSAERPLENDLVRAGISIFYLGKRVGLDPRMLFRIHAVIREYRPHVVHTHCYALFYLVPLMLARHTPTIIHTAHAVAERDAYGAPWLVRWALRRGVVPVAVSDGVARDFQQTYGLSEVRRIPNGIQVRRYRPQPGVRERARRELGIDHGQVAFFSAGRLSREKNHALLLESFARVAARVPGLRLMIAGSGVMEPDLRRMASRLGVGPSVSFLGERSDVPELLAASDVFVLSSTREGNPLSLLEAMAAGKAAVCTAVVGVKEFVEDGVTGRLVPPADAVALAGAMEDLARDPAGRQTLGKQAAAEAERRFDVAAMVRSYEELYVDLQAGS